CHRLNRLSGVLKSQIITTASATAIPPIAPAHQGNCLIARAMVVPTSPPPSSIAKSRYVAVAG
ncbi:MAG: hypothetical protein KDA72_09965, partial [Planctomycetales bacterium]|nr:hypothetical protein [Planctomycetales bacterium]